MPYFRDVYAVVVYGDSQFKSVFKTTQGLVSPECIERH